MSITAKELAKHLNLSTASVSVALNNKPGVSTSTRKMVLQAARELGYDFSTSTKEGKLAGTIYYVRYINYHSPQEAPFFSSETDIFCFLKSKTSKLQFRSLDLGSDII